MPAENEFERSMQQLLNELRVDPAPSDWDAVYAKLHPGRRRRTIWWWLPVVAVLLTAAIWMWQQPAGTKVPMAASLQQSAVPENPKKAIYTPEAAPDTNTSQPIPPHSAPSQLAASTGNRQHGGPDNSQANHNSTLQRGQQKQPAPAIPPAGGNMAHHPEAIPTRPQEQPPGMARATDSPAANSTMGKERVLPDSQGNAALVQPTSTSMPQTDSPAHRSAAPAAKNKARKWQWLLYAGGGYNATTTPPGGTKAAMDLSSSTPGGSVLITQSETGDGYHLAAGTLAQRQWHNNWKLQVGLGLNHSQWQGHTSVLRDSLPAGSSLATRTLVSDRHSQYKLWMLEMPMEIGLRVAGKKPNTWWLTTGFNHQLLLSLREQHSTQQATANFSTTSGQQSLNSSASTYQLYGRLGLQLNHEGKKARWQIAPLFQYGLTPVYKPNTSNTHLLNLQLQFRLYLSKR